MDNTVHLFPVKMTLSINFSVQIFQIIFFFFFWVNILQCPLNVLVFTEDCSTDILRLGLEQVSIMVLVVAMFHQSLKCL